MDSIEEKIGKLVDFAHEGPIHFLAVWFAMESVHLAPWSSWNENPGRGNTDPSFHLRWALSQNRDTILNDLTEEYGIAARNQYRSLQKEGLKDFYVYPSVRLASWGGSAGTLNEKPEEIFFEAEAERLRSVAVDEKNWVELLVRDLQ